MERRPAVAIFARMPEAGKAKTRLIPILGRDGAARFQAALLADVGAKLAKLGADIRPYVFFAGTDIPSLSCHVPFERRKQQGNTLGKRLERAFWSLVRTHRQAVVIGTDSPTLSRNNLRRALRELDVCDAVLGPCPDGGYYLIGLRRFDRAVFQGVRWEGQFAFHDTLRNLRSVGFSCSILDESRDIDRPQDFNWLVREMRAKPALRRLAPATWRFIRQTVSS